MGDLMYFRIVTAAACLFAGTVAQAQLAKDDFVITMRQSVQSFKARGEPKDRCSLGVQFGDNGRVLTVIGPTPLQSGDMLKSINDAAVQGKSASAISSLLSDIAPDATVAAAIERSGATHALNISCSNARGFTGPLVAAQEAAGRKDFKACVSHLATLPAEVARHWSIQFTALNCATHAKAIGKTDEIARAYSWVSALLAEARFVAEEQELAARSVESTAGYFISNGRSDLQLKLGASLDSMYATAGVKKPEGPNWALFRQAGEAAVRKQLVDPGSAQFEWPYGFIYGTWKPLLAKRIEGYWTCGQINARNRMGGYTGATYFVVVMDKNANVSFVDMDSGSKYGLVDAQCAKSIAMLPAAPAQMTAAGSVQPAMSIADELAKLAALRDKGILTQAEFDAQKAALLARSR
jgi:hypothetical protein